MKFKLEICAGSLQSALAAGKGGADRIELCGNLAEGGTTPSAGVIVSAVALLKMPVFVLIRPRPGDFLYSDEEFEAMKHDVLFCREHGVKGVVLGLLKADGSVDEDRTVELIRLARPMEVTFHRAFDQCRDPFQALEDIISLGCDRILTSGQAPQAIDGLTLLHQLNRLSAGRISIMPGSGISEQNAERIMRETGAREIHASLRSEWPGRMQFTEKTVPMGNPGSNDHTLMETDPERVRDMMRILQSL